MSSSRNWSSITPSLTPWILEAVKSMGYAKMTPVQASTIPLVCGNKDVIVEAVTGSGKTLAFVIPVIELVLRADPIVRGHIGGVIVAPTRELASQIYTVLNSLLEFQSLSKESDSEEKVEASNNVKALRAQLLIGGFSSVAGDVQKFMDETPQIIVATPGRLLDFLSAKQVSSSSLEILILDEADRLLELGFEKTLNGIIMSLPKQRRTGLFSATITDAVGDLVKVGLRNPVKILVKVGDGEHEQRIPTSLSIKYSVLHPDAKLPVLIDYINNLKYKKAIVYFSTCASVVYFYSLLSAIRPKLKQSAPAEVQLFSLHGKLPQGPRTKTLNNFLTTMKKSILLTTDVAARGLDIPEVDVVIQFDPPYHASMFLHRAGRAARAGRYGEAYVFLSHGREEAFVDLMKVKQVFMAPIMPIVSDDAQAELYEKVREWMLDCRERHDMAVKAYVSHVRFYTKHTMTSIFNMNDFDFFQFARAYGLIRLPSMPELKTVKNLPEGGWIAPIIDMDNYKYKDPQKESARLDSLSIKVAKAASKAAKPVPQSQLNVNAAWSAHAEKREKRDARREKKKNKREKDGESELNASSDSDALEEDWKNIVSERKKKRKTVESVFDL